MFGNLKSKNPQTSVFKNSPPMRHAFSKSPGATSSSTEENEGDRLVRCRVCGFICDRDRDLRLPDGSFAGLGVNIGEARVGPSYDRYYGAIKRTDSKNVLKNGGFTAWKNGWNLDPDYWTLTTTDETVARIETEDATYGMIQLTAAEPD